MNAWGWALIHFLWQGAVIGLALAVVLRAWRAKGPEFRYAAACAALGAMALAPVATALVLAGAGAGNAAVWVNDKGSRTAEALLALPEPGASLPMDWLVALWASGAALLLLRACGGWYVARRRTLTGIPLDYPLSRLMERMEMTGVVELMESAAARTPQVFGWLRPVIVVPAATLARLSPAEFEAVLAHELAHIRRRDYLVNLVQTVVESVLFYHPAVWWVSRRIREERELCCDDWAVRVCGDRVAYSKALMKVEEETPMLAMAASATGLKARIARLLGVESDVKWRWSAPMAPVAAAVLALMLMGGPWWAMAWQAAPPPPPPLAPAALDPPAPPPAPPADVDQEQPPPAPPAPPPPPPRLDEGVLTEDVRRDVERTLAELRQNKGKIQEELRRAVEQLRSELSKLDTEAAKSALERAVRDLQRQEIHLESQEAMVMQALQRAVERSRQVSDDLEGRRRERARRIELANEKFSKAGVSGAETDRGRLYIRLGPPDEIESRPGPPDPFEIWRYHDFGGTGGTMAFRFEGPDYKLKSQARQ
ncbi:MAG: GWxTD domain-containing protein [Bryobacteraceae bacterium]|nr:GWxTD domain-containing protein [Bryobacteraceae bacterium]